MKIGIILHPYGEKKPGGLPRIIFGWANALLSVDRENEYIIFLKETPERMPEFPGNNWKVEILGKGRFWLERLKEKEPADVYIFNTPVLPPFWRPPKSLIIALDYPYKYLKAKSFREKIFRYFIGWYHKRSLHRADHILAVSNSTKSDTVRFFGIPKDKVSVIYHGFTDICALPESHLDLPDKFFFFAGTIKERKNVLSIVKALDFARRRSSAYSLVIGGKNEGPYYEKILSFIKEKGLESSVIFLGHLNENQLSFAYKRAGALVFPSIVEGTGFPILEAMSCGTPVITSNIFGPAELGANGGAVLVDPYNYESIADAMVKVSTDAPFRRDLVSRGKVQASRFSWHNTGNETKALIGKIYSETI